MTLTETSFSFETTIGEFSIPQSLVDVRYIDKLANLLEECVDLKLSIDEFRKRLIQTLPLKEEADKSDVQLIEKLFNKLVELDCQKINGIWARIIKNAFAPLFVGKFDYIAGNPPWVNWESLPDKYRQRTKPLWEKYGLFPHGGMDTILGKGKKDISMLMTYVALDNYLKDGGKLGFVITQSVFKTSGSGQGFRRFILGQKGKPIRVVHVDDMVELQPFEGASNRTAVMIVQKGNLNKYPVSYTHWKKTIKGKSVALDNSLEEVIAITARKQFIAEPIDINDLTSSWLTGRPKALKAVKKILGKSDYSAYEGVNSGGANSIYWLDVIDKRENKLIIVSNITENAKQKADNIQCAIEEDLVYPFIRGRDVKRWKADHSIFILMVQDPNKRCGIEEEKMKVNFPKTYLYLKNFENFLRRRAAHKRYFTRRDKNNKIVETGPFYSMFNVGTYTLSPYKVVWRYVCSDLKSCVISSVNTQLINNNLLIPDHRLILIPLKDKTEAHYVCGMLNNSVSRYIVKLYVIGTQISTHILEHIPISKFDAHNTLHKKIAELSEVAHSENNEANLARIETDIDEYVAQLWKLEQKDLDEIKNALRELSE